MTHDKKKTNIKMNHQNQIKLFFILSFNRVTFYLKIVGRTVEHP